MPFGFGRKKSSRKSSSSDLPAPQQDQPSTSQAADVKAVDSKVSLEPVNSNASVEGPLAVYFAPSPDKPKKSRNSSVVRSSVVEQKIIPPATGMMIGRDDTDGKLSKIIQKLDDIDNVENPTNK